MSVSRDWPAAGAGRCRLKCTISSTAPATSSAGTASLTMSRASDAPSTPPRSISSTSSSGARALDVHRGVVGCNNLSRERPALVEIRHLGGVGCGQHVERRSYSLVIRAAERIEATRVSGHPDLDHDAAVDFDLGRQLARAVCRCSRAMSRGQRLRLRRSPPNTPRASKTMPVRSRT